MTTSALAKLPSVTRQLAEFASENLAFVDSALKIRGYIESKGSLADASQALFRFVDFENGSKISSMNSEQKSAFFIFIFVLESNVRNAVDRMKSSSHFDLRKEIVHLKKSAFSLCLNAYNPALGLNKSFCSVM